MKVKPAQTASHGRYKKKYTKNLEKRWIPYEDSDGVIIEYEVEVDLSKEDMYNEAVTLYNKSGCYVHYLNKHKTIDKLV